MGLGPEIVTAGASATPALANNHGGGSEPAVWLPGMQIVHQLAFSNEPTCWPAMPEKNYRARSSWDVFVF
jgi:hypothetical protein